MKKQLSYLFAIPAMLFAFSAQGHDFVQVDQSKSGQSINVAPNQVLEIKLPKRPSTGYTWVETSAINATQRSIEKIGNDEWVADATPVVKGNTFVGQSGTQIIRYAGTSQGTTVLTFELKRPWEKNNPPMDLFTVTVVSGGKYTGGYTVPAPPKPVEHHTSTPVGLPTHLDFRSQCTPVQNQGQCGDCWAFATTGAFECNLKIVDGTTNHLSEEFVTDCYTQCSGCGGGYCAFDCWVPSFTGANSNGGGAVYIADDATTCNQTGQTGTCHAPYPIHQTITSWSPVSGGNPIPPDANMKQALYTYGPLWIAYAASGSEVMNYTGGIAVGTNTQTDHANVIVGYVDSAACPGGGYWILRNSWGTGYGYNGYLYLSYGSDEVGTQAAYLVYKGGIPYAAIDAGAASIVTPVGTTCNPTFSPVVTLENFGTSTLTSCTILYHVDANANLSYAWTGSLAHGASVNITLPSMTTTGGAHTFTSLTSNPNNTTDGNPSNDQTQSSFNIASTAAALPLVEGFESSANLPAGWSLYNPDNNTAWAVTTAAGHNSTNSIFFDNCNPPTDITGQKDRFITTTLDFSQAQSTATLTFDVAYADLLLSAKTYSDTLAVLSSIDCGTTWKQIYVKGGATLATAPQLTTAAPTCFTPTSSQWRNETVSLSALAGQSSVMFAWENRSMWGEGIYVDNINILGLLGIPTINSLDGFSIYPNPASTSFTIAGASNAEKIHYTIYNVVGAEVRSGDIATNGNGFNGKVEVSDISRGMYFIRVNDGQNTWTKKLNLQ